jgi:hypothetical protein
MSHDSVSRRIAADRGVTRFFAPICDALDLRHAMQA